MIMNKHTLKVANVYISLAVLAMFTIAVIAGQSRAGFGANNGSNVSSVESAATAIAVPE